MGTQQETLHINGWVGRWDEAGKYFQVSLEGDLPDAMLSIAVASQAGINPGETPFGMHVECDVVGKGRGFEVEKVRLLS